MWLSGVWSRESEPVAGTGAVAGQDWTGSTTLAVSTVQPLCILAPTDGIALFTFFFPFTIDVVVCLTHFFALAGVEEIENRVVPLTNFLLAGVLGLSVYPIRILMVARLAQYFVYPMASPVFV